MKTPDEILYKRNQRHISLMQMETPFVCEQAAIEAMEIYGRQCFEAARDKEWDLNMPADKYGNYEQYKNELK
jgi:hypothetical protein